MFCIPAPADEAKQPCLLERQNVDKWHSMLNKASKGEYQQYLNKRYQQAKVEYLKCLRRGKQEFRPKRH